MIRDLDPPETLRGQLQRGLGRGYLHVQRHGLDHGADHEVLLHCILYDPRWDRQVEERASYYAGLALLLDLCVRNHHFHFRQHRVELVVGLAGRRRLSR